MEKTDAQQIQELMFHYGNACDSRDYALLRRCFVDGAVVRYSAFSNELIGHDALADYLRPTLAALDATHHIFTNFIVDVDGDTGVFSCGLHAQHVLAGAAAGPLFTVGGKYRVDVARTPDGWKMTQLEFKPIWASGNPALVAHDPQVICA